LEIEELHRLEPVPLDEELQAVLARAAAAEGAAHVPIPSGAGHDAMILARHVPAAMLFVPSRGGISHSPDEYTPPEQCEAGARILARALAVLAREDYPRLR
jgi:allantoate deiminase